MTFIVFPCPSCGRRLRAPVEKAGVAGTWGVGQVGNVGLLDRRLTYIIASGVAMLIGAIFCVIDAIERRSKE